MTMAVSASHVRRGSRHLLVRQADLLQRMRTLENPQTWIS
jgi:hypothetical protein